MKIDAECPECSYFKEIDVEVYFEEGFQDFKERVVCDCGCEFDYEFEIDISVDVIPGKIEVTKSTKPDGEGILYVHDKHSGDLFQEQQRE